MMIEESWICVLCIRYPLDCKRDTSVSVDVAHGHTGYNRLTYQDAILLLQISWGFEPHTCTCCHFDLNDHQGTTTSHSTHYVLSSDIPLVIDRAPQDLYVLAS